MKKLFTLAAAVLASFSLWADGPVVLINQSTGAVNGSDFRCTSTSNSKAYTVDDTEFAKYIQLGGAHTTPVGAYQNNKIIQYDAKTNSAKVTVWAYNKASSDYKFYISMIQEGAKEAEIHEFTATKNQGTKGTYTFTPSTNATIYIHVGNNSNVFICQVQVEEEGDNLLQGGEVGYSVRLDSIRVGREKTLFTFEGIEYNATSNNLKIWTPANLLKLKSTTEYIKFTLAAKENVVVGTKSGTYSITRGEYNADSTYTGTKTVALEAGVWYIRPNGSNVEFTSLAFAAYVQSDDATLKAISVGENALDLSKFVENEGVLEYNCQLTKGTTEVPEVAYELNHAGASAVKTDAADVNGSTTIVVTAENGVATKTYKINFSVKSELGHDATLSNLKINGVTPADFAANKYAYNIEIGVYDAIPTITAVANDDNAAVVVSVNEQLETQILVKVTAEDGVNVQTYTVDYSRAAATALAPISESTTWDWSKAGSATAQWSGTTLPTNAEEFNFADVLINPDAGFNAAALSGIAQYANRGTYFQGNQVAFKTTVPGTVVVTYSNTGDKRPYRHVKVNNDMSAEGSADQTMKDTEAFTVSEGDVVITFYIPDAEKPQAGNGDNVGPSMGRISKIVFTKSGTTALGNTEAEVKAVKRIVNGQLLIEKNGVLYNAQGAVVK